MRVLIRLLPLVLAAFLWDVLPGEGGAVASGDTSETRRTSATARLQALRDRLPAKSAQRGIAFVASSSGTVSAGLPDDGGSGSGWIPVPSPARVRSTAWSVADPFEHPIARADFSHADHDGLLARAGSLSSFGTSLPPPSLA